MTEYNFQMTMDKMNMSVSVYYSCGCCGQKKLEKQSWPKLKSKFQLFIREGSCLRVQFIFSLPAIYRIKLIKGFYNKMNFHLPQEK